VWGIVWGINFEWWKTMATIQRIKTKYPGVFYIEGKDSSGKRKEKIYYIRYRRNDKMVEEKAGRQFRDDMTPARAAGIRSARIEGKEKSNTQKRTQARQKVWTVDAIQEEYFSQRPDNKASRTDKGRYEKFLKGPLGNKKPADIDKLSIDRIRVRTLKDKSPQTVKHILALFKRIIRFGTDHNFCSNILFNVKLPKVDNVKTEDLSPVQMQRLVEVLNRSIYTTAANIMKLALFTGMRRGEIFKLRWDHIDFDKGFIRIHEPKGGKSQNIPLNKNARDILKNIPQTNEYIFPAKGGGPRKDINKDVAKIKAEAGLPKGFRGLHGLRHVFATVLASSGDIDMLTLQKLLTHKDQRMTQRYIHYREEALVRAGDQVDNIFENALQKKEVKIKAIK
jgi:integrase